MPQSAKKVHNNNNNKKTLHRKKADIANANLQSGSLGDELQVATGLIFGASEAEASDSGADSHVVLRKLSGKAT